MNLVLNTKLAESYSSASQIARVLTEDWVLKNSYCPCCGADKLRAFENNRPVADFICKDCAEEFELKSKSGKLSRTITDGGYLSMIDRITSENNPNFFFLTYSKNWCVDNFFIVPKQFFTEDIIIKRPPLASTAKRAGWIGCNINLSKISESGKIFLVKDSCIVDSNIVHDKFASTLFMRHQNRLSKGWILDILYCIDQIKSESFSLEDVYSFEAQLKQKYPENNFIKDKIRQQLQILRDKGIIIFTARGKYQKVWA